MAVFGVKYYCNLQAHMIVLNHFDTLNNIQLCEIYAILSKFYHLWSDNLELWSCCQNIYKYALLKYNIKLYKTTSNGNERKSRDRGIN